MQERLTDTLLLRTIQSDADVERLADFNSAIHSDTADPDPRIGAWTRDLLMPGRHPTVTWDDFLIVEDTATGEIVSSLGVIPQTWAYAGIPFDVGRIELVGTHPDYRHRGLIRTQFEAIHARCAELGLLVQSITGIPYFYRQFGYEFALELRGGHGIPFSAIPETPVESAYTLREWQEDTCRDDLPRLQSLYDDFARGKLVTCPRPDEHWHHRYLGLDAQSINLRWLYVIARRKETVGYVVIPADTWGPRAPIEELVLDASYPEIVPWLLPRLRDESAARFSDADPPVDRLELALGSRHPIYDYLRKYNTIKRSPYAWYIRVADLAAFIWQIKPALEQRIARGPLVGLTRTLTVDFYTGGLHLEFGDGQLTVAENLSDSPPSRDAETSFPPLVFLQLLFGYRSLKELRYAFPDVYSRPEIRPILDGLFPRRQSWVMELY